MNSAFHTNDEKEEWSDIDESESEDEIVSSRKRKSWQDIIKRENAKPKNNENENDENECAICFDCFVSKDACCTTPCGHKFHSNC